MTTLVPRQDPSDDHPGAVIRPRRAPIDDPALWTAGDLDAARGQWQHDLDDDEVAALADAARSLGDRDLTTVLPGEVHVEALRARIAALRHELLDGVGVALVRGLERDPRVDDRTLAAAFWVLSLELGRPVPQNDRAHLLGTVTDLGAAGESARPNRRAYERGGAFGFHSDLGDVVGLVCIHPAVHGGASTLASGLAVHEVLRLEQPELLEALYEVIPACHRGEELPGTSPWYPLATFSEVDGVVSCHVASPAHVAAQRYPDVRPLRADHLAAFDAIQQIAARPDLSYEMVLQRGHMQFINNHTLIHGRGEYVDPPAGSPRRLLHRVWLMLEPVRPLPAHLLARRRGIAQPEVDA